MTASFSVGDACNAVVVFLARVLRVRVPDLPCGFDTELVFPDGGSTPIRFPEYNMQCEPLWGAAVLHLSDSTQEVVAHWLSTEGMKQVTRDQFVSSVGRLESIKQLLKFLLCCVPFLLQG